MKTKSVTFGYKVSSCYVCGKENKPLPNQCKICGKYICKDCCSYSLIGNDTRDGSEAICVCKNCGDVSNYLKLRRK